jgi:hypothetical protein
MDMFLENPYKDKVESCSVDATQLGLKLVRLMNANKELVEEKERIPSYTAQWAEDDYVAREQQEWNLAAEDLLKFFKETFERKHNRCAPPY